LHIRLSCERQHLTSVCMSQSLSPQQASCFISLLPCTSRFQATQAYLSPSLILVAIVANPLLACALITDSDFSSTLWDKEARFAFIGFEDWQSRGWVGESTGQIVLRLCASYSLQPVWNTSRIQPHHVRILFLCKRLSSQFRSVSTAA
jgi:hypothetical protein